MTRGRQAVHNLFTTWHLVNTYQQSEKLSNARNKMLEAMSTPKTSVKPL